MRVLGISLKKIKTTSIISVSLTLILILLLTIYPNINWIVISSLISFLISVICLYVFFISSDIYIKKIFYFKFLNRIGLLVTLLLFIYWGVISPNSYGLAIAAKTLPFILFNLIIMTIIKIVIKREKKSLLKEWTLFILLMLCMIIWGIVKRQS